MRQPSRKIVSDLHAILIQGDSVRMTWGIDEPRETPSIKRQAILSKPSQTPPAMTDNQLRLRLAEELDYAVRMLDLLGRELAGDAPIIVRHGRILQSIDIIGQTIGHIAAVIRSSDNEDAINRIGMNELKARLMRRGAL